MHWLAHANVEDTLTDRSADFMSLWLYGTIRHKSGCNMTISVAEVGLAQMAKPQGLNVWSNMNKIYVQNVTVLLSAIATPVLFQMATSLALFITTNNTGNTRLKLIILRGGVVKLPDWQLWVFFYYYQMP